MTPVPRRRHATTAVAALAVAAALVLGARHWLRPDRADGPAADGPPATGSREAPAPLVGPRAAAAAPSQGVDGDALRAGDAPASVRLRRDAVLARVNGVALTLADLVALPAAGPGEHELAVDAYRALLDRAIERELAKQAAAAAGVGLDDVQLRSLAALRAGASAPGAAPEATFDRVDRDDAAAAELEARDLEGVMLLVNLTAHAGGPPSLVTAEMARRAHQEQPERYGPWPADPTARAALEARIRADLAPSVAAAHDAAVRAFAARLRTAADVELAPLP